MIKKTFIEKLAKTLNTSKADAERKANAVFETISKLLAQDDELLWPKFGRFSVTHKAARSGRNPATGKPLKIAAKAVPTFKAATQLKQLVAKKVKAKPKA
jgi:DNA-binding protein HU-beta